MLKYLIFLSVLIYTKSAAQKIDGIYIGNIISDTNVLLISTKDSLMFGSFYESANNKFPFTGIINRNEIRGLIQWNEPILILGKFSKDTLKGSIIYGNDTLRVVLNRVSKKLNYPIEKLYKNSKSERDVNLIGKWVLIKMINPDGTQVKRYSDIYEYLENGRFVFFSIEAEQFKERMASGSKTFYPELQWATNNGWIFTISNLGRMEQQYVIRNDTLIITNERKQAEILVRKK